MIFRPRNALARMAGMLGLGKDLQIFAEATGQSIERIEADTQRDFWLNTQEALDYGLLGKVIRSVDELK